MKKSIKAFVKIRGKDEWKINPRIKKLMNEKKLTTNVLIREVKKPKE